MMAKVSGYRLVSNRMAATVFAVDIDGEQVRCYLNWALETLTMFRESGRVEVPITNPFGVCEEIGIETFIEQALNTSESEVSDGKGKG